MVDAASKTMKQNHIKNSFLPCGLFLSNDFSSNIENLNSNLKIHIADEKNWSYEIQLFDALQSLPKYIHQHKEFIQDDIPNLFLEYDGNAEEDDEFDSELMTKESVISESLEYADRIEENIQNSTDEVVKTIEFNDDLFFL